MHSADKAHIEPLKTVRKEFSKGTMAAAFLAAGGKCEKCDCKLDPSNTEYDHVLPCGLGGDNSLSNCQCLCVDCHKDKTKSDVKQIAKTKRQYNKDNGIKTRRKASIPSRPFPKSNSSLSKGKGKSKHKWSSSPMPGSKASGWKKNMDGTVSRRSEATA